jgi:cytidylate kinase
VAVITISRQYAAGGSLVAAQVAEQLGWPVIDNDLVDRVAEQAGLPKSEVEEQEERVPSLLERLAAALAISSPEVFVSTGEGPDTRLGNEERMVRATEAVMTQAAQDGDLVVVGRGAQAHLAEREDALHVFIVAPRDKRITAAMERLGMSRDEATDAVDGTDDGRRRYVKTYYDRHWEDAENYHLVLNSGVFTYEQCTEMVVAAARMRGWAR